MHLQIRHFKHVLFHPIARCAACASPPPARPAWSRTPAPPARCPRPPPCSARPPPRNSPEPPQGPGGCPPAAHRKGGGRGKRVGRVRSRGILSTKKKNICLNKYN